jgi:MFS family permease
LLAGFHGGLWALVGGMLVFFVGFNLLEALLPSLVSKLCPPGGKGTAMGIYSSSQFLGAFVGGVLGGFLQVHYGVTRPVCGAGRHGAAVVGAGRARMPDPPFLTSVMLRLGGDAGMPALTGVAGNGCRQVGRGQGGSWCCRRMRWRICGWTQSVHSSPSSLQGLPVVLAADIRSGTLAHQHAEHSPVVIARTASGRVPGSYGPSPLGWWEWKQHT